MSELGKVTEEHRRRRAVVYVRQSSVGQVERNTESAARQYALRERAIKLGWPAGSVAVVDEDTGRSGASSRIPRVRAGSSAHAKPAPHAGVPCNAITGKPLGSPYS